MKKVKSIMLTFFTLVLFTLCLSFDTQAVMSDKEVKRRLSDYSDSYIKAEDGVAYLEYENWDTSEEKMYEIISTIAKKLIAEPVEDYCRVNLKFFFTHKPYGSDFETFFDKLTVVKKKFGNFLTEWSRYNKMTMSVTSYSGGEYFSANFNLYLNGSEQDKYGKEYDEKLLSLVSQAQSECDSEMETVQFFLKWLDENARYMIFTGYTNDPRYALNVGYTVCGGYANAFKDLCNASGIPAIVPVNMEANHAWSQVYVDGIWYTADLCDVVKSESGSYNGYLFTDPDLSTDCNDFVEKYKKDYVDSFEYKDRVILPGKIKKLKASSVTDSSVRLKWSAMDEAEKYQVQISTDGKKWKTKATVKKNSCTVKKLSGNKKYYFRVRAVSYSGKGPYSSKKAVTTLMTRPETKAKAGKRKITVSWDKIKGAKGYVVVCARNKEMMNNKKVTVKKGSKTTATVKGLKSKKNYYVKVRAYKTVDGERVYGSYSNAVKVKVK